ncbi:hypothetical protein BC832DRAFT_375544 [Gaertneriomyces semiglobifer]|nr:hypothetical protein BC832DRAFT_375544 [Gaertneriomyces semiglobifer]
MARNRKRKRLNPLLDLAESVHSASADPSRGVEDQSSETTNCLTSPRLHERGDGPALSKAPLTALPPRPTRPSHAFPASMSVPPLPESVEALSKEEIIRHLYTYTELLFTRTSRLAALESHLSCAICTTYFVCPFTLQCGHTFCYNCISAWFDNLQQNEKALRCPTCRADIRLRPHRELVLDRLVEEYLGDLCDQESIELMENVRTTREALGSMRDPPFHRHMPNNFGNEALLDAEDGVTRCTRCNWEIYNGQCQGCGFVYDDPRDESVYSGSDDELGRLDDESEEESES